MSLISSPCQRFDDVSDRRVTHCRDDARARTREHAFYRIDCMRTSGVGHVCGLCVLLRGGIVRVIPFLFVGRMFGRVLSRKKWHRVCGEERFAKPKNSHQRKVILDVRHRFIHFPCYTCS